MAPEGAPVGQSLGIVVPRREARGGRDIANASACISPSATSARLEVGDEALQPSFEAPLLGGGRRACGIADVSFSTPAAISSSEAGENIITAKRAALESRQARSRRS